MTYTENKRRISEALELYPLKNPETRDLPLVITVKFKDKIRILEG